MLVRAMNKSTLMDDVMVLTDDSDSFDSEPGEWLRIGVFFAAFRGRPFHFGANTNKTSSINKITQFLTLNVKRLARTADNQGL